MNYVKHRTCETEIILKRIRLEGDDYPTQQMWCTTCERVLTLDELNNPGPYAAVLPRAGVV